MCWPILDRKLLDEWNHLGVSSSNVACPIQPSLVVSLEIARFRGGSVGRAHRWQTITLRGGARFCWSMCFSGERGDARCKHNTLGMRAATGLVWDCRYRDCGRTDPISEASQFSPCFSAVLGFSRKGCLLWRWAHRRPSPTHCDDYRRRKSPLPSHSAWDGSAPSFPSPVAQAPRRLHEREMMNKLACDLVPSHREDSPFAEGVRRRRLAKWVHALLGCEVWAMPRQVPQFFSEVRGWYS